MHSNLLKTAKEEIKNFPVFFSSLKPIFYFEPSNDLSFLNPIRSLFENLPVVAYLLIINLKPEKFL
jgi:hypothetical protein